MYRAFPEEGRGHAADELTAADYKTNPPTSGTHNPDPGGQEGLYVPGNEPEIANWVHTLEHGRILFQYKPGTNQDVIGQLTTLFNEDVADSGGAYHSVLMQNNSGMKPQVAAVAWRHYMTCAEFGPEDDRRVSHLPRGAHRQGPRSSSRRPFARQRTQDAVRDRTAAGVTVFTLRCAVLPPCCWPRA